MGQNIFNTTFCLFAILGFLYVTDILAEKACDNMPQII